VRLSPHVRDSLSCAAYSTARGRDKMGARGKGVREAGDLSSCSPDRKTDALWRFRTGCERASPIEARDACGARQGTVGGLAL
jgi:hypothetical protein